MIALGIAVGAFTFALTPANAAERKEYSALLGTGARPSVTWTVPKAAGSGKVTHVVWATTTPGRADPAAGNAIAYCRSATSGFECGYPGARAPTRLLELPEGGDFSGPQITALPDGTLVIVDSRCCGATLKGHYVLTSRDDGATWQTAHPTLLERAAGDYQSARYGLLEAVHPTDGTLGVIGGSVFGFGTPTVFQRVVRDQAEPGEVVAGDFSAGSVAVHTKLLGLLPDGRPFAVGTPAAAPQTGAFWRAALPGADPNSTATGWSAWAPLALAGMPTGIAYQPGRPTWLMFTGDDRAPRIVSFDGVRLGKPRLLGGAIDWRTVELPLAQDLTMDRSGGLNAVWVTAGEGCPRLKRCLVFRHVTPRRPTEPKVIVRSVPVDGPIIEHPEVSSDHDVVWTERIPGRASTTVRRGYAIATREYRGGKKTPNPLSLEVPPNPITGTRFQARVRGKDINAVTFTLLPPACPRRLGVCYAFRRNVVITRRSAPFRVTFAGLPEARGTSTSNPAKNRRCGVDPYLYRVRAVVERSGQKITLADDVSICPRVR